MYVLCGPSQDNAKIVFLGMTLWFYNTYLHPGV